MELIFNTGKSVKPKMHIGPTVVPTPSDPTVVHSPDNSCTKIYACSKAYYDALAQAGELEDALYIIVRESDPE